MDFSCFFETYLVPLIPLIAAYTVYLFGKRSYFQQKEYELVVSRYLDEGIDATSQSIDESLAIFRHNWAHTLTTVKNFLWPGRSSVATTMRKWSNWLSWDPPPSARRRVKRSMIASRSCGWMNPVSAPCSPLVGFMQTRRDWEAIKSIPTTRTSLTSSRSGTGSSLVRFVTLKL